MNFSGNKKFGWLKKAIIGGFILLLPGAIIIWYLFSLKFDDTAEVKADFKLNSMELIHEFENNDSLANLKYTEKIIVVNGIVSDTEAADTTVNVKMVDSTSGSYIIFTFQQNNVTESKKIKTGDKISIKGSCSGGAYSSILETEFISFKRCIISK